MSITLDGTNGISSAGAVRVDQITDENGAGAPSLPNGLTVGGVNYPSTGPLSNRNKIINGAMVIDQRNAGAAVTANGSFPVDRFFISDTTDGAFSAQRVLEAPAGFLYSAKFTTTTADASLTTTQNIHLHHRVEGLNVADLGWGTSSAQTVTLSFWVRSSLTGTFGGAFRNSATDRSYPFTYSISAADTWEYKTVTVAGDTSGTWLKDTGNGVSIMWGLGAGPDRSGTAGAWAGATYVSATGAVSVIGTLNATWQITGVQLEAGTVATPFEHRSFGQELALCQRYFEIVNMAGMTGTAGDGSVIAMAQPYKVTKRAAPTLSIRSGTASHYNVFRPGVEAVISTPTINPLGNNETFMVELTTFTGLTNNHSWTGRCTAGTFGASAEL
jgi:hypothetical protein